MGFHSYLTWTSYHQTTTVVGKTADANVNANGEGESNAPPMDYLQSKKPSSSQVSVT